MSRGKLALGLDIGSTSVKMIQLKEQKKRGLGPSYALESFGMKPLPPEAIVDGALMNSSAIVQSIQELMGELRIKGKREAAIGVSGNQVIIKKIAMPKMSPEELEESIQWEAEQYIPFDVKDVNLDTQILDGDIGAGQMDVLLVAAKKDMINDYTTVVTEAGLTPAVVDVDAFAVQNTFTANYDSASNDTVVLINAGASVVNINIVSGGMTVFTRDVSIGGNQFTEEIQKQLNVSFEEAESLKMGGGLSEADAMVPQEVERVLTSVAEQVAGEIQRSLDFYAGTSANSNFGKVILSGGTAKIAALMKTIETRVGVPVEILDPFRNIEVDGRKFDQAFVAELAPMAAVAVGLALRKPGDKLG